MSLQQSILATSLPEITEATIELYNALRRRDPHSGYIGSEVGLDPIPFETN